jgi:dihydropteroate synthase
VEAGIAANSIVVDPGFGFGKRPEHNAEIIERLGEFRRLGFPILIGASGKRFADEVGGGTDGRLERSLAATVLAVENGADLVRVHDVAAAAKAIRAADTMARGSR